MKGKVLKWIATGLFVLVFFSLVIYTLYPMKVKIKLQEMGIIESLN